MSTALDDRLLIVATDRISAFDYILPTGIPDKGKVLTQLSIFWFDFLRDLTPTHFLTARVDEYPEPLRALPRPARRPLHAGEARQHGRHRVRGARLPLRLGLEGVPAAGHRVRHPAAARACAKATSCRSRSSRPSTKAQIRARRERLLRDGRIAGRRRTWPARLRDLTLAIYARAARYAETRGIIIADTKFEFGFVGDELVLGDEVLTPDSSRFWPADTYRPGGPQFSYDKQYVRDYLESIHWNKQPPAPALPDEVAAKTSEKYRQAYRVLTGRESMNWLDVVLLLILAASVIDAAFARASRARSSAWYRWWRHCFWGVVLWQRGGLSGAPRQLARGGESRRLFDRLLRRAAVGRPGAD